MADDAIAVLDEACGVDVAAHWVGFSMGGLQLVDLANRRPDRVVSLCFLAGMSPHPEAGFGPDFFGDVNEDPVAGWIAAMGDLDADDRKWVQSHLERADRRAPARPDAGERHMAAAMRLGWPELDDLSAIEAPTIVVHGTEDRTLPLAHAEALAGGIRGAELMIRQGMGHLPRPRDWAVIAGALVARALSTP